MKNFKSVIILTILITLLLSITVLAASDEVSSNQPAGSFKVDLPASVNVQSDDYVPVDEVASVLDMELDWSLEGNRVNGNMGPFNFRSSKFVIANGHLYIPIDIFLDNFGVRIEIRGNNYFIYNNYQRYNDLELTINTNKNRYSRDESMAVSILLMNQSDQHVNLRFPSSQRYDLVLKRYNREIWRLSGDQGYTAAMNNIELAPDEFRLNTALITPGDEANLYYGTYKLYAEVKTAHGEVLKSDEIDIRIR
ncbi:MAG: BsuPI-related putative proteinase inhibitor [Halanaerobiales bacterium]